MLPSSLLGLIVLIAFLAPGFVVTLEIRRKLPLFAAGQSQVELVLWICLGSLASHLCLLFLGFLVCCAWAAIADQVTLSSFLTKTIAEIFPKDVQSLKIRQVLLGVLYIVLAFGTAKWIGPRLARLSFTNKGPGIMDFESAWLDAFSTERRNYVLAILDNGYVVTGIAVSISADLAALTSGIRDIVLSPAEVFHPDGSPHRKIAQKVTINTRDIKILETRTERDKEEESYV